METSPRGTKYFDWRANRYWHSHADVRQLSLFLCTCENMYGDRSAFFSHPKCTQRCCRNCGQMVQRQAATQLGGDWAFEALYCCRVCAHHWTVRCVLTGREEACPECSKVGLAVVQAPHVIGAGKQVDEWTRADHARCKALCDRVTNMDPVVFDFHHREPDKQIDYVVEWICNARPDMVARQLKNVDMPSDVIQLVLMAVPRADTSDIRVITAGARVHALLIHQRQAFHEFFGSIKKAAPPPHVAKERETKEDIKTDDSVCQFCRRRVGASQIRARWCDEGHNTWGCDSFTTCGIIGTTCCHCDQ